MSDRVRPPSRWQRAPHRLTKPPERLPTIRDVHIRVDPLSDRIGIAYAAQEALALHAEEPRYDRTVAWGLAWTWEAELARIDEALLPIEVQVHGGVP